MAYQNGKSLSSFFIFFYSMLVRSIQYFPFLIGFNKYGGVLSSLSAYKVYEEKIKGK
jgi:hypothetical protein